MAQQSESDARREVERRALDAREERLAARLADIERKIYTHDPYPRH